MAAPKGNQFWKNADPACLGRPMIFESPIQLWERAKEYFLECDDNPLIRTETIVSEKGTTKKEHIHKIPYTWEGLYVYLGVCNLEKYKKREDFVNIITHIGNIIRNQKFTGAAAGLFNANIIARDLGLKEQSETKVEMNLGHKSNGLGYTFEP